MEAGVRRQLAGVRVAADRTSGEHFFLFSYRTFSTPDSALDPVVAGVTFTPAGQGVAVEADASGEQTGDRIATVPPRTVAPTREALLAAAHESARLLCQSAGAVAAAVRDPNRRAE